MKNLDNLTTALSRVAVETLFDKGFRGHVILSNVRTTRAGIHHADVAATEDGETKDYRLRVGRGKITLTKVRATVNA